MITNNKHMVLETVIFYFIVSRSDVEKHHHSTSDKNNQTFGGWIQNN